MRTVTEYRQRNYGYLLFLMAAAFSLFNRVRGTELGMAGYFFTSLIAYPGMLFLMGREASEYRKEPEKLRSLGFGLIALGFAQKVLLFWIETWMGRGPAFHPFSTSGVPWLFLVGGMCALLVSFVRERRWMKRWLLPLTVLAGLGVGLVKFIGDFMCLSRLVVYLPFFLLGFGAEEDFLARLGKTRWLKAAGLLGTACWGLFCLLSRSELSAFRLLADNNKWYKDVDGLGRMLMGVPARSLFYLVSFALILGLWAMVPGKKLPFVSGQGQGWKSGYFWFTPMAYLIAAPVLAERSLTGLALSGLVGLAVLLGAPARWPGKVVHAIVNWSDYLSPEPSTSKALEGGSFYRRHQWGIGLVAMFTCCFMVGAVGYVFPYFSNDVNLVWSVDGLLQQYPAVIYTRDYILGVFETLMETGELVLPQWDFSVGFGLTPWDVIRKEPFSLLFLFATEENLEAFFNLVVVLRMYVCGLAFLWYGCELGKRERLPIVMGAVLFVFADFPLLAAVRQPFFVTTLLTYFLLTVTAVERYLRKGRPTMFVIVIALQFINGYYSSYINSLLMAVYLLLRLWGMYGRQIKTIVLKIVKMIGWYLWGLMMAMFTLMPTLMSFLTSSRSGEKIDVELFYGNSYYADLFSGLNLEYGGLGYRSYVGFASIGFLACILLFIKRRKGLGPIRAGLCAVTVFICSPVFGWIFNGFGYITNRWCFAIPFVVALALMELAPEMADLSPRERKYLTAAVLLYSALVLTRQEALDRGVYMGIAILGMTTVLVLMLKELFTNRRAQMGALALVTTLNVTFSVAAAGMPEFGEYANQSIDTDEATQRITHYMADAMEVISQDETFYRVARPFSKTNQSLMLDYNGVSSYYSVISSQVTDYCVDVGLNTQYQTFLVGGLDERTVPMTLASVKYYVTNNPNMVPYGFTIRETVDSYAIDGSETVGYIYENDWALPMGYTYTGYVTREEYEQMTAIEKQQVMLYGALLEEETDLLAHQEERYEEEPIPVTVTGTSGATVDMENKTIQLTAGGRFYLQFEGKPNCEYYLVFRGLEDADKNENTSSTIAARMGGWYKEASMRSPAQTYYFNREYLTFDLGWHEEAQTSCTVAFSKKQTLEFEDLYILCVPVEDYGPRLEALGEVTMENVTEAGDRITGTLELEENRLVVFSIPWASGWKAWVNGEERELIHANGMYCGLILEPGSYDIELRFELPGQSLGNLISAAALLAVVPVGALSLLRRKQKKQTS